MQLAEALKESEVLEVSEDNLYVKRRTPFGSRDEAIEGMDNRSIYACPFPFDSTLEQLQTFFSQYALVKAIRLRRFLPSKDFKGSIFVEFEEPEAAQKVGQNFPSSLPSFLQRLYVPTSSISARPFKPKHAAILLNSTTAQG